jgi:isoquinoline 1-oxidoreductase beta subunit
MNAIVNCSRRSALKAIGAAGGLVLGTRLVPGTFKFASAAGETTLSPNVFVAIAKDGTVTLFAHRSEMGQGIRTGLTALLADELEADWARVKVEQADGDAKYGDQYTDGSRSIVKNYQRLREFGATARLLLEQAAAKTWDCDPKECHAENHKILRVKEEKRGEGVAYVPTGESLDFGELVKTAATLPVPDVKTVTLKDPKDFRYIGKEMPGVDLHDMMLGAAKYTIDIRLPGRALSGRARQVRVVRRQRDIEGAGGRESGGDCPADQARDVQAAGRHRRGRHE